MSMSPFDISVRSRQPSITPSQARSLKGDGALSTSTGTTQGGSKVKVGLPESGSDTLFKLSSRERSDSRTTPTDRRRSDSLSGIVLPRSGSSSGGIGEVGTLSRRPSTSSEDEGSVLSSKGKSREKPTLSSSSSSEDSPSVSSSKSKSFAARLSDTIAAAPAKLAHGLKLLFNPDYQTKDYKLPFSGVRFKAADRGNEHGPYVVVKDKDKGVEPGYMAKKNWTDKDTQNMLSNENHKFYKTANSILHKELNFDIIKEGPLAAKAQAYIDQQYPGSLSRPDDLSDDRPTLGVFLADKGNKDIRNEVLDYLKNSDKKIEVQLRGAIMAREKKFNTLHMIKLDYVETDMKKNIFTGTTKVRIPADKQKFALHREFTAQTRDSANRGAVRETMANDLMKAMGINSQKLKLVPTQYADGHAKLLLDGTFATGPKGGKFSDFDGRLKDGFFVKCDAEGKPEKQPNGRYVLDQSINDFGRNKVLMLLLADRDALGSTGGNKGFADNTFIGIDPGHALEEKLLSKKGDVHSDFSFDQPSRIEKRGYKNLTIFDQQPLSEKMEGVRTIKKMMADKADVAIFEDYSNKFGPGNDKGMNFSAEIGNRKDLYVQRRDDILDTFAERLAVDDFKFQNGVSGDDDRQKELSNKTLDILDNLEKLTSKTSGLSPKKDVQLERPRVIERKEWHVAQNPDDSIKMSYSGSSRQARQAEAALTKFIDASPELKSARDNGLFQVSRQGGELSFTIKDEKLGALCLETVAQYFTNEAIMAHKHPAA